ncbi:MAG: DNA sulfur modification protein DndD [Colwellia sp.]|jgi:DNA sulfur modification protein DndD
MILNTLGLRDFGVFSGQHTIDLAPRVKYNRKRPIVLFGGLNGAGKTTTLTAVRLALYGRQSMGRSISQAAYHEQLAEYIHKPNSSILPPCAAAVELEFSYGKHGRLNEYKVVRSWEEKKSKVIEHLEIYKDEELLEGLSFDQLQSFLSELIPIGVADLFFFDGEKIADLAEDKTNEALADAINRLLGLDIIERLRADLSIYLREHTQDKLPKDISKELKTLEKLYSVNYAEYEGYLNKSQDLKTELVALDVDINSTKQRINDLGGAWAQSRQAEELRATQIIGERDKAKADIKDLFSDSLPLLAAPKALAKLLHKLESEKQTKTNISTRKELNKHLNKLRKALTKDLGKKNQTTIENTIESTFSSALDKSGDIAIRHDLSDTEFERIKAIISTYAPQQAVQLQKLIDRVESLDAELQVATKNIARAPDQSRLDDVVAEIESLQNKKGHITKEIDVVRENAKKSLRAAMENLRRLRDLDAKYSKAMSHGKAVELAANTRGMLSDFSERMKKRKLATLEQEFIKSFSKLARKDDMNIQAHIDPSNFNVSLTDAHGKLINKKKLSAGEKQIYAIAMLEALGRTSGRNLPIIIDTPLGRLDSKHRTKLVKNYFPTASHQVLILSTDTEIDEGFYSELSPEISHAFSVDYDSKQGCSEYKEGYFWRSN